MTWPATRLPPAARSLHDADATTRNLELGDGTGGPRFWNSDLRLLTSLTSLERLCIARASWTREDLEPLASLHRLRVLEIAGRCESSHAPMDLSPIARLPRLRELDVCNVCFHSPAPLAGLGSLTSLSLRYDSHADDQSMFARDSDLAPVCASRRLASLRLRGRTGLRLDLRRLGHLSKLVNLELDCDEAASVEDLTSLRRLTRLERLHLRASARTLEPLFGLPLQEAYLPATVTHEARLEFAARVPGCRAYYAA